MKVWLLDNGSIVIEHTQLLWNVPGPQARIPVYSVLVEHEDGLFLFDTGIDLDHMNRVLPFELPEQTPEVRLVLARLLLARNLQFAPAAQNWEEFEQELAAAAACCCCRRS